MAGIMSHNAISPYISPPILWICFVAACLILLLPIRDVLNRPEIGISVAAALVLSCYLNAVIYCIVSVNAERG
jgi:hypothetical protein